MTLRRVLLGLCLALAARAASAASADPRTLVDAPLLPEGSAWNAPTATVLANVADPIVLDLGSPAVFRALLLQADGNDVYWVETSDDGAAWTTVWRVPRAFGSARTAIGVTFSCLGAM